jgi:hypothetical protein
MLSFPAIIVRRLQLTRGWSAPGSAAPPEPTVKKGSLLKQRDIMKGWRRRYFVLEGKLLSYYKERTDTVPRGAVFLAHVRGAAHRESSLCDAHVVSRPVFV